MCELFGLSCATSDRALPSLSTLAKEHSKKSCDGWGIGYYKNGTAHFPRTPEKAKTSAQFFNAAKNAKSNIIIAHIRLATSGDVCEENCHPFHQNLLNKDWIFAHNGHVSNPDHHSRSGGSTDSEQIFNTMLDQIQNYIQIGKIRGIYPGLQKGIQNIFERYGRDINLNFLMSDGTILYAYNHYDDRPIYFLKRNKDYGGAFLLSTQKLSKENWKKLRSDSLLLVSNGEVLVLSDPL